MNLTQHDKLDTYFQQVQDIILIRQDWVTGLLPASTAVNMHGNYTDAWVRDNVYSILSAWGLALAYRRVEDSYAEKNSGRAYLLEQSVVKLMRGLLTAMMRQAPKVEKFKQSQNPLDALHAKYDTKTGAVVVGDHEWGHLQLDATSLFLLMLAQMTASGLRIVFTIDEVNFVQNLVHYISRTYRTPDYGIWERGHKTNHGIAELNASSIGMAKAALEALSGFNLFGKEGGQASVVHVISDDIARTRITLESLLPRESISKEADSAVLSITGFPAFAVDNPIIRARTEAIICEKLEGRYGCKRFLLDGHQTAIEDSHRLHYDPHELKQFMDIECEWPLFFTYLLLNNVFTGDNDAALRYRAKLESLLVEQDGRQLLPELYSVPKDLIEAEKANPHSQQRVPNENVPLVWAQSLFMLGSLIQDGLLCCEDIDPLGRHKVVKQAQDCKLQIQLLAQDEAVQNSLMKYGIRTQTLAAIAPIQIREANELADAYTHVGRNDRIGLTGRPLRQLRTLATSKMYILAGECLLFLPQCLNQKGFYLAMDNRLLIQRLRLELAYIYKHWDRPGNPLVVMTIKQNMLGSHNREVLIEFIKELQQGSTLSIPVQLGTLADFAETSSHEKINYLHDFQFSKATWEEAERPFFPVLPIGTVPSAPLDTYTVTEWEISADEVLIEQLKTNANLYAQLELLNLLSFRHGLDYDTGLSAADGAIGYVRDLLEEIYQRAGDQHAWYIVRRCAGLLGKYDINLEQAATDILVRQHALTLGRAYSGRATLTRPADSSEILQTIRAYNNNDASEHIIIQELIIYLGMLIKSNPELFIDMHTVRVGHILQLLVARQKRESGSATLDQAFNEILSLPPYQLSGKVKETLEDYSNTEDQLGLAETLHYEGDCRELTGARFPKNMDPKDHSEIDDWYGWREQQGSVGRENDVFFASVWDILHHCKGLAIGDKLNSKNRLDSENTLSQSTAGEQSFKLHVNHLLNKIQAPVYRQLTVEALKAMASIFRETPSLHIDDTLLTDIIIGHAVRVSWLQAHPESKDSYEECVSLAWQDFYRLPPHKVANGILDALIYLLNNNERATL
ncbi:glycoside hydrolase family 15 protein [Methylobacter sp.]|uniref:glycoside hydrolase family 15 protein n=1 Tax=Methylobacter sp. TaxID=2051955 RepID=UPI002488B0E6|nr:glycoside hydrolase family 15 protein [Methylobacter sp.]MDI1275997.1 glycoside hydrolase family 15 protein [Methylobacter sp.]MDI1356739.1 glycoside hydrolase family 15 protein [Methylobacter sp.]